MGSSRFIWIQQLCIAPPRGAVRRLVVPRRSGTKVDPFEKAKFETGFSLYGGSRVETRRSQAMGLHSSSAFNYYCMQLLHSTCTASPAT
jgi:hypothetical protein